MTETRSTDRTDRRTMADVDHVHRYDPGASVRFYSRGPAAFTDGGEDRADEEPGDDEEETERTANRPTMKDVDHTPPDESREVNRVFERGGESNGDER